MQIGVGPIKVTYLSLYFPFLSLFTTINTLHPQYKNSELMRYGQQPLKEPFKNSLTQVNFNLLVKQSVFVGPCHLGKARAQVADGGTAFDMEGSCE
jgi:hypothetical protein